MIYEYECKKCGQKAEIFRRVADRDQPTFCMKCGEKMERNFTTTQVNAQTGGRIPGWCHSISDKPVWVKSKYHFKELCKRNDLRPVGME